MHKKIIVRKALLFILFVFLFNSGRAIEAVVSHSIFYLADPVYDGHINPLMEAYWQVNSKTVHFSTNAEEGIIARLQVDVMIRNDTGRIIKEDNYIYQTRPCANVSELASLNILELKRYLLTPGFMKMVIRLTDLNDTANRITLTDTFTVAKLTKQPFYSSVELIDTFYDSDIRSPFRKHGKQFIPLCESFYDSYRGSLSYYAELYQLKNVDKSDFPLVQSVFISKNDKGPLSESYLRIDTITSSDFGFVSGKFDIHKLVSGNYYVNVMLGNKLHKTIASKSIFFQRLNTYKNTAEVVAQKAAIDTGFEKINVVDLNKTFLAKYKLPQISAILKMMLPMVDPAGANTIEGFLKKPDENYMRYFIYNYFQTLDSKHPDKAWKEYSDKVTEVNKKFNSHGKPGYETDRGYMYLKYGTPSEIVTQLHEKGSRPYEIWQYNVLKDAQGKQVNNVIILFFKQDETDFDFRLLHSNISGELHNAAWRSYLYNTQEGTSTDNAMSNAEQYIGNK